PEHISEQLISKGIVPLCGLEEAMSAIAALSLIAKPSSSLPIHLPITVQHPMALSEFEAKKILAKCGVRIPRSSEVNGSIDAVSAAEQIGFPVVLKGVGIAHKTEAGAVALNLTSIDAVKCAADLMPSKQMLVEEMVTRHVAELLIGVVQDPAHGYILTLAAGGALTELLQDRVSLVLPVMPSQIEDALGELRISKLLSGYRGGVACNTQAIIDAVMAVQDYVISNPVEEVEINPLLCGEDFAIAADALIRCGEKHDR
ncbi:MAG: acetate--CoA ligase family protein, partial [Roseibium sp.]|uniref:acetate--CoA ligase family protein n=1 Tax=Roseibium sp. TaxID=1936156 RepID=UPI0026119FD2